MQPSLSTGLGRTGCDYSQKPECVLDVQTSYYTVRAKSVAPHLLISPPDLSVAVVCKPPSCDWGRLPSAELVNPGELLIDRWPTCLWRNIWAKSRTDFFFKDSSHTSEQNWAKRPKINGLWKNVLTDPTIFV